MSFVKGFRQGLEKQGRDDQLKLEQTGARTSSHELLKPLPAPTASAEQIAALRSMQKGQPQAPAALPDRIELNFGCAVMDEPFAVTFEHNPKSGDERYFITGVRTAFPSGAAGQGKAPASPQVSIYSLDHRSLVCPRCMASDFPIRCGTCGRLMCDGRTVTREGRRFFRCSDSCGAADWCEAGLQKVVYELKQARPMAPPGGPATSPAAGRPGAPPPGTSTRQLPDIATSNSVKALTSKR
jgi:hypothetical protein